MTQQQWGIAWDVYRQAREIPPAQLSSFLDSLSIDPAILAEVIALLENTEPTLNPSAVRVPEPESRVGAEIGRYSIRSEIGRGGMGVVYAATDQVLGRPVAIKFIETGAEPVLAAEAITREATAASTSNHPNIVTVHEVLRDGAGLAIVMELVEGATLRERSRPRPPLARILNWLRQSAEGLDAAHARGIVHRDLKPENIMIRPDGYVKILDFGLARPVTREQPGSGTGLPFGTLRYMSPEQVRCEATTTATDVFALGCVFYELLTGEHPFASTSAFDTAHNIVFKRPAGPSTLGPEIPAALDGLVMGMLSKEPELRPPASEIAERARAIEAGHPVRGNRWMLAVAVVVVLVALTAVLFALLREPAGSATRLLKAGEIAPFASLAGRESMPSFSPDGRQLAFGWNGGGRNEDIYVKLVGAGNPLRLTTNPAVDSEPSWAPDGLTIAFLRQSTRGGPFEVITVPALGGAERTVGQLAPWRRFLRRLRGIVSALRPALHFIGMHAPALRVFPSGRKRGHVVVGMQNIKHALCFRFGSIFCDEPLRCPGCECLCFFLSQPV